MPSLDELNALPAEEAEAHLRACCASGLWVERMLASRPYAGVEALLGAADAAWEGTGPEEWLEAFAGHPRIGERPNSAWSEAEQGSAARSDDATRERIARLNAEYERRFGYIYIVCATGRSGEEILTDLGRRLGNDPDRELRVAASEQHKITRLRLRKLIRVEEA